MREEIEANATGKMERVKIVISVLAILLPAGFLVPAARWVYKNFMDLPNIIYYRETETFSMKGDFEAVSMRVYPQMIIRYKDYVISVTYLSGYLESDSVQFINGEATVLMENQDYSNRLFRYVRNEVIGRAREKLGDVAGSEIEEGLKVYVSYLCGVQYQRGAGGKISRCCFIERDGFLIRCSENDEKIAQRLYDSTLVINDDPATIMTSAEVETLVACASTELIKEYGS